MLEQAYIIQWDGRAPEDIILYPINFNRYCPVFFRKHSVFKRCGALTISQVIHK